MTQFEVCGWRMALVMLVGFHLILIPEFASSQTSASSQNSNDKFDDWQVECTHKDNKKDVCQMFQSASVAKGEQQIFLLSISPKLTTHDVVAIVTVPIGVYLSNGIQIQVDKKRPFKVLYEVCDKTSCHAGFKLAGTVLSAFKGGIKATFRVWTAREKAVQFVVSLKGFTAAYNYLNGQEK